VVWNRMYASTDCTGSGKSYPNLIYLEQNHELFYLIPPSRSRLTLSSSHVDHSLAIGGRSVNSNVERIWLATYDGTSCHDAALNYYVYGPVGCAKNLPTYQCVILRLT
jgi:hypothetical protein